MALPLKKSIVIKIGGSTLGAHDTTLEDVVSLQKAGELPVVVHGGGKAISEWLDRQGIATRFVRGLRVTDAQTLPVVLAVLSGLVNKELVAAIVSQGGQAIGLSGIDANIIAAEIKDAELGYVGEIVRINPQPIVAMLGAGYIPVIAPVGAGKEGETYNINADLVAGRVAASLEARKLILLTDQRGVLDKEGELISTLTAADARDRIADDTVKGGMIPKVRCCLEALEGGVGKAHIIDGREEHAILLEIFTRGGIGTEIVP